MSTETEAPTVKPTRPTYGQPTYDPIGEPVVGIDGETYQPEPESAGWDLAFGCKLSFGAFDLDGPLLVNVGLSDREAQAGICQREVTSAQLRLFAEHLLRLAGDYDRRTEAAK